MSIFDQDGKDVWRSGALVKKHGGRYVSMRSLGGEAVDYDTGAELEATPTRQYECTHGPLRGAARCLGCGRTKNEIRLDEG